VTGRSASGSPNSLRISWASPGASGSMPGSGSSSPLSWCGSSSTTDRGRHPSRPTRPACTAPVTAHPTCVHGTRHGPPDLPARLPSRPTRPACTAPVTAPARTPHGSLHGLSRLFAAPSESGFHAWCAGHLLLDSPVKSSSLGFRRCGDRATTTLSPAPHGSCTAFHGLFTAPLLGHLRAAPVISSSIRRSNLPPPGFRWCGDRVTTTPSTAPARPFTAFSRRSQVLGEEPWWGRDGVAWDRWLKPCKNIQTYASETPRPASREVLLYVFAQR
jgi:hypothetical protein